MIKEQRSAEIKLAKSNYENSKMNKGQFNIERMSFMDALVNSRYPSYQLKVSLFKI